MRRHELKCWPGPFQALLDGVKHHEVRKDDRAFRVGDALLLREWDMVHKRYTGRGTERVITYATVPGTFGLPPDLCVLSVAAPDTVTLPRAVVEQARAAIAAFGFDGWEQHRRFCVGCDLDFGLDDERSDTEHNVECDQAWRMIQLLDAALKGGG